MTRHHPPEGFLLDLAAGSLPEALRLVVAGHLSYCPECRAEVGAWEALGGEMLAGLEPAAMSEGALQACLDRLDNPDAAPAREVAAVAEEAPIPPILRPYIGADLQALGWQSVGGFFDEVRLPDVSPGHRVSMLRVPPGKHVPEHGHEGNEFMLVLAGSYKSGGRHYQLGDFSFCDGSEAHTPIADDGEDCICLLVLDAPLAFSDLEGQRIAPLLSM